MAKKWVYLFREGDASMRDLLGGKGAGVAEMTRTGVPVPPGFTITTEACNAYYETGKQFPEGLWEQVIAAMKEVEQQTGTRPAYTYTKETTASDLLGSVSAALTSSSLVLAGSDAALSKEMLTHATALYAWGKAYPGGWEGVDVLG